jgi:cyclase
LPSSADRGEGSIGWGPRFGQTRQREFTRANARAKRFRREMTPSEKALWDLLRQIPDAHFRKQVAVDNHVFDFAEYGARLLIELDGAVHDWPDVARDDAEKQKRAETAGFRVLRFTNTDVAGRLDWVMEQVCLVLDAPHPHPPRGGGGGESSDD